MNWPNPVTQCEDLFSRFTFILKIFFLILISVSFESGLTFWYISQFAFLLKVGQGERYFFSISPVFMLILKNSIKDYDKSTSKK